MQTTHSLKPIKLFLSVLVLITAFAVSGSDVYAELSPVNPPLPDSSSTPLNLFEGLPSGGSSPATGTGVFSTTPAGPTSAPIDSPNNQAEPSAPTTTPSGKTITLPNPLGAITSPQQLIANAIRAILGVIGSIALLIFIYGGILWMTAEGDEKKVKKGWDTLTWATIGLVVIFGSYTFVNYILQALLQSTTK